MSLFRRGNTCTTFNFKWFYQTNRNKLNQRTSLIRTSKNLKKDKKYMYFHISNSYAFRPSRHTGCLLSPCNVWQYLTQRLVLCCHNNAARVVPRLFTNMAAGSRVDPQKFCASTLYADFLPPETVQPTILPRHHVVTKMIVQHHHEQGRHVGGVNQVYAQLCSRYWIIAGREVVCGVEKNCSRCKRLKAKPAQQIMAPLPRHRITPSLRAFARSGVDFAGPFETVQGRGRTRTKRYLCLFTCLTTRAVHLELAYSLDTNSFLNAFYRFVGRRVLPQVVILDNGTNFVGGQRELSDLVAQMDKEQIERTVANQKVCW